MPVDQELLGAAVASAPLAEIDEATFFRSIDWRVVERLGVNILDGAHAGMTGGRYNAPQSPPTSYFAASQTLASLESEHARLVATVRPRVAPPRLVVSVTVANLRVLDLTNRLVISHLGVPTAELTVPTKQWQALNDRGSLSTCQIIGAAARDRSACDGIVAPSWFVRLLGDTLPRMENLILFMDASAFDRPRSPRANLSVYDPDRLLPKPDRPF